jgi:hypothetical protein
MLPAMFADLIGHGTMDLMDEASVSKLIYKYENTAVGGHWEASNDLMKHCILRHIEDVFGDHATSVESILEACKSVANECEFFKSPVNAMRMSSPLSLKITFEQLRRGRTMPLVECFRMDNRIIRRLTRDTSSDFYIGVRAKLLTKSGSPQWNHRSLDQVSDALVSSYFAPLSPEDELQLCREERMKYSSL